MIQVYKIDFWMATRAQIRWSSLDSSSDWVVLVDKFLWRVWFNRLVGGLALTKNGQPTLEISIHEDFYVGVEAHIESGQKVLSQEYRGIAISRPLGPRIEKMEVRFWKQTERCSFFEAQSSSRTHRKDNFVIFLHPALTCKVGDIEGCVFCLRPRRIATSTTLR